MIDPLLFSVIAEHLVSYPYTNWILHEVNTFFGCKFSQLQRYQILLQDAQLSQRDRAAGCVGFGQKWKTGTAKLSNSVKKNAKWGLLRRSRSFKVIEVGTN